MRIRNEVNTVVSFKLESSKYCKFGGPRAKGELGQGERALLPHSAESWPANLRVLDLPVEVGRGRSEELCRCSHNRSLRVVSCSLGTTTQLAALSLLPSVCDPTLFSLFSTLVISRIVPYLI